MLVIKAEIWPGGREEGARQIGEIKLANKSYLADISDYVISINNVAVPHLGIKADTKLITVYQHDRRQPVWELVKQALNIAYPHPAE